MSVVAGWFVNEKIFINRKRFFYDSNSLVISNDNDRNSSDSGRSSTQLLLLSETAVTDFTNLQSR